MINNKNILNAYNSLIDKLGIYLRTIQYNTHNNFFDKLCYLQNNINDRTNFLKSFCADCNIIDSEKELLFSDDIDVNNAMSVGYAISQVSKDSEMLKLIRKSNAKKDELIHLDILDFLSLDDEENRNAFMHFLYCQKLIYKGIIPQQNRTFFVAPDESTKNKIKEIIRILTLDFNGCSLDDYNLYYNNLRFTYDAGEKNNVTKRTNVICFNHSDKEVRNYDDFIDFAENYPIQANDLIAKIFVSIY